LKYFKSGEKSRKIAEIYLIKKLCCSKTMLKMLLEGYKFTQLIYLKLKPFKAYFHTKYLSDPSSWAPVCMEPIMWPSFQILNVSTWLIGTAETKPKQIWIQTTSGSGNPTVDWTQSARPLLRLPLLSVYWLDLDGGISHRLECCKLWKSLPDEAGYKWGNGIGNGKRKGETELSHWDSRELQFPFSMVTRMSTYRYIPIHVYIYVCVRLIWNVSLIKLKLAGESES